MSEEPPEARLELARRLWGSLESRHDVDIAHYNALLGVYVENEKSFSVEEILADVASRKLKANCVTFQRIIENYSRDGDLKSLERTLAIMQKQRISPNVNIYNSLILAHGVAG